VRTCASSAVLLLLCAAAAVAEEPAAPFLEVRVSSLDDPTGALPPLRARAAATRVEGGGPFDPSSILAAGSPVAVEDGTARVPVPPGPGRVLVAAAAPGYAPGLAFAPKDGGPASVALRRGAPATIRVHAALRGEGLEGIRAGASVPGALVSLVPGRGFEEEGLPPQVRRAVTGEDGAARIEDLAVGPFFDLEASAPGFSTGKETFVLAGGTEVRVLLEPAGRITGRVIRIPGGGPAAEVQVRAGGTEATTAQDGTFLLEGLPPGVFAVEVTAAGMLPLDRPAVRVDPGATAAVPDLRLAAPGSARIRIGDGGGKPLPGIPVRLLPAEGTPGADAPPAPGTTGSDGAVLLAPLWPGAGHRILVEAPDPFAPRVTESFAALPGEAVDLGALRLDGGGVLRGTVLGPDGAPVPDAALEVFDGEADPLRALADHAAGGPLRRTAALSADGAFEIRRVPAGLRSLLARAPGRRPAWRTRIEVAAGGEVKDLALVLPPGALVAGTLLGEDGLPAVDALVVALAPPLDAEAGRARTGPNGAFRIEGLPAGLLCLRVTLPGESFPDPLRPLFEVVAPSEGNELRIPLCRVLEGTVLDPTGGPPRGAVAVGRLEPGPAGGPLVEVVREVERVPFGPDGAFATRPLPAGRYRLRAESPDGRLAVADAEVGAGAPPRATLVLAVGSAVRGRIVTGPVVRDLRQVSIRLLLGGRAETAAAPAAVEEGGGFTVNGVPPGEHDLVASLPGLAPVVLRNILVPPEGGVVDVGDLLLGRGTTLRLRVQGETRAPLPGVAAAVVDGGGLRREETTGTSGLALFIGLAPGPHLLEARLPSGILLRRPVEVPDTGEFEEVLDLGETRPGTATVRRGGGPVPGAAVRIYDAARGAGAFAGSSEAVADERGVARIPGLPDGRVLVEVTPPGEPPVRLPLSVRAGCLDVDLPTDGIEGRVVALDSGRPVPGARVLVFSCEVEADDVAEVLRTRGVGATADADGHFTFPSIARGRWRLEASARGFGTTAFDMPLSLGGVARVELALPRAGRARGTVRDPSGRPVPGALVETTDPGTGDLLPGGRRTADAAGIFDLDGIAPGPVVLTARAGGIGASPPEHLSFAPGEIRALDLWLVPGGTLEVAVVGPGGLPVPDAAVEVRDFFGRPVPLPEEGGGAGAPLRGEGRTGPGGLLRVPGLRAGIYQVRAWKGGLSGEARARVDPRYGARTAVALLPLPPVK